MTRLTLIGSACASVAFCALAAHFVLLTDMHWDAAIDVEVARSLGSGFTYQGIFEPNAVYDPFVSSNGPLQYVGGMAYSISHNIGLP